LEKTMKFSRLLIALLATGTMITASAQEKVLNLYSARHYQTDEALYANFTKQTGIKINRIEAKEDELLERIRPVCPGQVETPGRAHPRQPAQSGLVRLFDPRPSHRRQQGRHKGRRRAEL
jgi:hypothetical protein